MPKTSYRMSVLATGLLLFLSCAGCGAVERSPVASDELAARDRRLSEQQLALFANTFELLLERMERDVDAGRKPSLDMLLLSGGGARGAFGAGFLLAWRTQVPADHPLAWREFDVVSGISTGALQSPFAAIGTEESLRRIDTLYRSASPDWVTVSSLAFFSSGPSLADTTGLDAVLRETIDLDLAEQVAALQERDARQVFVGSVDLDLARPVTWRLGDAARRALDSGNPERLFEPMRASASIPAAFSPTIVDGAMHVDGALFGNIRTLSDSRLTDRLLERWQERRPDAPMPAIRFWVVINNPLRAPPQVVPVDWGSIFARSSDVQMRAQTIQPLEYLALSCELLRARHGLDVELRWTAIPPSFEWPEVEMEFDARLTQPLSDLGQRLGADPDSWKTEQDLGIVEREGAVLGRDG